MNDEVLMLKGEEIAAVSVAIVNGKLQVALVLADGHSITWRNKLSRGAQRYVRHEVISSVKYRASNAS